LRLADDLPGFIEALPGRRIVGQISLCEDIILCIRSQRFLATMNISGLATFTRLVWPNSLRFLYESGDGLGEYADVFRPDSAMF